LQKNERFLLTAKINLLIIGIKIPTVKIKSIIEIKILTVKIKSHFPT